MGELMKLVNGEVQIDSRMIAEHFSKAHSDVLKDIRDEISKLQNAEVVAEGIFSLGQYLDKNNQQRPCYTMTDEGALQLAARYDAVARRKLIVMIKDLKKNSTPQIDSKFLFQIAAQLEEKEKQIQTLKPKADFFDAVADSKTAIDIGQAAKVLNMGVGRNNLFDFLRSQRILMENNQPYQKYIDLGYFRMIEQKYTKTDGSAHINIKTLVYQKGLDFIRKKLLENKSA